MKHSLMTLQYALQILGLVFETQHLPKKHADMTLMSA